MSINLPSYKGVLPERVLLALGIADGITYGAVFGRNADVDAAEDLTNAGGNYPGHPVDTGTSLGLEENLEMVCSSADDAADGTGAQEVTITYLDAEGFIRTIAVETDGTTDVDTGVAAIRCIKAEVTRTGTGGVNAGTVTIRHITTTANVFAVIAIGANKSEAGVLTVPANHVCAVFDVSAQVLSAATASITASLLYRLEGNDGYTTHEAFRGANTYEVADSPSVLVLPALADVKMRVVTVSTTNVDASGAFNYVLIPAP